MLEGRNRFNVKNRWSSLDRQKIDKPIKSEQRKQLVQQPNQSGLALPILEINLDINIEEISSPQIELNNLWQQYKIDSLLI